MDLHILALWLPLLLLPSALILFRKMLDWKGQNKNLPPGPPRIPIIGNLHQLGNLPHQSLWELSKKHGPVMFLKLGGVPTVVVSSSEAAKQVLKVHDLDCCSRPALTGTGRLSYSYRDVAFSPFGDYWREMRKVCVLELFSIKRVQSFQFIREEEVSSLVESISQLSSSGRPVDLSERVLSLTANIICRVAFGKSFRGSEFDNNRLREVMHEASAMLGSFSFTDFFPWVGWLVDRLTGFHARLERIFNDLDTLYQQAIDYHLDEKRTKQGQEDIIDVLLKIEREEIASGGGHFTRDHLKAILMNIFTAGVDTSAITIIWALSELVRNPRFMKKAQKEVRNIVGNKVKVTEADVEHLDYLKLIVKETLRLHPPGPMLIPREVISPFEINGYNILPKTRIYVNVWAIGRDPSSWKDPEEFNPERFFNNVIDFVGQKHFELLPFGGGRRGCPGMNMGLAMVELSLANLLYHFDWELPKGLEEEHVKMEEAPGLTLLKKDPLNLVPVKYHSPL